MTRLFSMAAALMFAGAALAQANDPVGPDKVKGAKDKNGIARLQAREGYAYLRP